MKIPFSLVVFDFLRFIYWKKSVKSAPFLRSLNSFHLSLSLSRIISESSVLLAVFMFIMTSTQHITTLPKITVYVMLCMPQSTYSFMAPRWHMLGYGRSWSAVARAELLGSLERNSAMERPSTVDFLIGRLVRCTKCDRHRGFLGNVALYSVFALVLFIVDSSFSRNFKAWTSVETRRTKKMNKK